MHRGRCECGRVTYEVDGPLDQVTVCHCSQCRRTSGHIWASIVAKDGTYRITSDDTLKWFASSDKAERGFCTECGSSLFYRMHERPELAIASGTLDQPTGLALKRHIFAGDKADYYDISDKAPQFDRH